MSVPSIFFVKASACGNDFLLIDGALAPPDISAFTRRICDRHDGVGADGVEWMLPHFSADLEIRLINADGSAAEISGNGTRCVAAYVCSQQRKERISILTGAGTKICTLMSRSDSEFEFEMEMGEATVGEELLVRPEGREVPRELSRELSREVSREVRGIPVSMGNPHYVVFVPQFPGDWQSQAEKIQRSGAFPEGVNVEYVSSVGKHDVKVMFFERGVGETRSSGTGSCASAVAAVATGWADFPVKVHATGGTQTVRIDGGKVFLRGPARLVCQGEFFLS